MTSLERVIYDRGDQGTSNSNMGLYQEGWERVYGTGKFHSPDDALYLF